MNTEHSNLPMPDFAYFPRLIRRHKRLIAALFCLILVVAVAVRTVAKNDFESSVVAVLNELPPDGDISGSLNYTSDTVIMRLFAIWFESPDFLAQVVDRIGRSTIASQMAPSPPRLAMDRIKTGLAAKLNPAEAASPIKGPTDQDYAFWLKDHISVEPEPKTGILNLVASAASPELAKSIAEESMELFIQSVLENDAKRLNAEAVFLQSLILFNSAPKGIEKRGDSKKSGGVDVTTLKKDQLQAMELELANRIDYKKREQENMIQEMARKKVAIKNELNTLLSKYRSTHPLVRAKRAEIRQLEAENNPAERLNRDIRLLQQRLWRVKAAQLNPEALKSSKSMTTDIGTSIDGVGIASLERKIEATSRKYKQLVAQIADPSARTRLKIVKPAALNPNPASNTKNLMFLAVLAVGCVGIVFVVLGREFWIGLARDGWLIQRRFRLSPIAQFDAKMLSRFPVITPAGAKELKSKLGDNRTRKSLLGRMANAYRGIASVLKHSCNGRTILFLESGKHVISSNLMSNFLNIYAEETGGKYLLIDLNYNDPLYPNLKTKKIDVLEAFNQDLMHQIIQYAQSEKNSFDVLPVWSQAMGQNTQFIYSPAFQKLILKMQVRYDAIFIRGLPEHHQPENDQLVQLATDSILILDAAQSSYDDVGFLLRNIDQSKMRGFILGNA